MQKILIIEDEEPIAKAEMLLLEDLFEVAWAKDGNEGMEMIEKINPDLIVLDLMLPNRGGYDVCFSVRQNPKYSHIKIVMVTAKNLDTDEEKGLLVGADDYLTKPFEPEELVHVVKQVLASNGSANE